MVAWSELNMVLFCGPPPPHTTPLILGLICISLSYHISSFHRYKTVSGVCGPQARTEHHAEAQAGHPDDHGHEQNPLRCCSVRDIPHSHLQRTWRCQSPLTSVSSKNSRLFKLKVTCVCQAIILSRFSLFNLMWAFGRIIAYFGA